MTKEDCISRIQNLEAAIEFARSHYHLPQNVYDVFRGLLPDTVELVETHNELYERLSTDNILEFK